MRNDKGQFAKGNSGKPKGSIHKLNEYKQALQDAITTNDIEAITEQLTKQAKGGCIASIKLLLEYTLGKPTQMVINQNYDHNPPTMNFNELIKSIRNEK